MLMLYIYTLIINIRVCVCAQASPKTIALYGFGQPAEGKATAEVFFVGYFPYIWGCPLYLF